MNFKLIGRLNIHQITTSKTIISEKPGLDYRPHRLKNGEMKILVIKEF